MFNFQKKESVYPKLPNFSKNIWKHFVEVLRISTVFKQGEYLIISVILFTVSLFINWLTLMSLWDCFFSVRWIELATAFLSIQSNEWNTYWELEINLSSQPFSLACTHFEGVIGLTLSLLKWFIPVEYSLGNARAPQLSSWGEKKNRNLIFSRCYVNNFTWKYIRPVNIMHHSGKARKTSSFSFSLSLPSISSSLSVWSSILNSLPFLLVRNFHNSGFYCSLTFCL